MKSEAPDESDPAWWDTPPNYDNIDIAGRLAKARAESNARRERGEPEPKRDWSNYKPLVIPPGKENTVRGLLRARLNRAYERARSFDEEEQRKAAAKQD